MRKLFISLAAAAAVGSVATTALAAGKTIKVGDNFFVRQGTDNPTVTVSKGTRVTFRWVGDNFHNVRAVRGPVRFKSKTKAGSRYRYRRTFKQRGTYRLVCEVHRSSMRMTLRVK